MFPRLLFIIWLGKSGCRVEEGDGEGSKELYVGEGNKKLLEGNVELMEGGVGIQNLLMERRIKNYWRGEYRTL